MFRPLSNAVAIRPDAEPWGERKAGSLYLPDREKKEHAELGTVVSFGAGYRNKDGSFSALPLRAGDRVLFAYYGAEPHEIDGEKLLIVPCIHVYAVIEAESVADPACG
jgi:chaperonin GroES